MERSAINRAAREILSVRSRRRPWRSLLRRAFPAAILIAACVGALGWFGFASRGPDPVEREPSLPPRVAIGPPPATENKELWSLAETLDVEIEDAPTNWEFE
jgi:hypothetical protein